jgi:hypothetical protein
VDQTVYGILLVKHWREPVSAFAVDSVFQVHASAPGMVPVLLVSDALVTILTTPYSVNAFKQVDSDDGIFIIQGIWRFLACHPCDTLLRSSNKVASTPGP